MHVSKTLLGKRTVNRGLRSLVHQREPGSLWNPEDGNTTRQRIPCGLLPAYKSTSYPIRIPDNASRAISLSLFLVNNGSLPGIAPTAYSS
jgi:hypothetical protein